MVYRIIVADDEADLAEAVAEYLGRLGHVAVVAADGAALARALAEARTDLLLLDLRFGREDGQAILERLKQEADLSIILISGHAGPEDRLLALRVGADDVLSKPLDLRELAARISAALRQRAGTRAAVMRFERASADLGTGRLLHDDGRIERLDAGEVALLRVFRDRPGQLLSRAALLELAPGGRDDALERSINNRIMRIRAKIGTDAIATVRGGGYRFDPPVPRPGRALPETNRS